MKEAFIEKRFNASSIAIIENANAIIDEYLAEGHKLTLRQLYYQFVSRKLLRNKMTEYKRLGSVINDARLAGLIDWEAIEDHMRNVQAVPHYAGPAQFVETQVSYFAEDLWKDQDNYCEVWIEKDALTGVISRPCTQYRVPLFACRGYASQSSLYEAGARLRWMKSLGKNVTVFHLGDHDPSGIDMTRDNDERINMFVQSGLAGVAIERLALNKEQIVKFDLPPDPAKLTDSRVGSYMTEHGDTSWELDALPPREIVRLVVSAIEGKIDMNKFKRAYERERESRKQLEVVARNWKPAVKGAYSAEE